MGYHTFTCDALWSMALLGHGGDFFNSYLLNLLYSLYSLFYLYFNRKKSK